MVFRARYDHVDEIAVQRIVDGRHTGRVGYAEAAAATRRLAAAGYSDGQIAARLGYRRRSVVRIRVRHNIPAALTPRQNAYDRQHDAPNRPRKAG